VWHWQVECKKAEPRDFKMIDNMATNSMLLLHSQQATLGIPTSPSMPGAIGASATFPPGVTWTQPAHGECTLRCTRLVHSHSHWMLSHQILSSNTLSLNALNLYHWKLNKYTDQIHILSMFSQIYFHEILSHQTYIHQVHLSNGHVYENCHINIRVLVRFCCIKQHYMPVQQ